MRGIPRSNRSRPFILLDVLLGQYGPEARNLRVACAARSLHSSIEFGMKAVIVSWHHLSRPRKERHLSEKSKNLRRRRVETCSSDAGNKCYFRFGASAFVVVCSGARFIPMPFVAIIIFWLAVYLLVLVCLSAPVRSLSSRFSSVRFPSLLRFFSLEMDQPFSGLLQISSEPLATRSRPLLPNRQGIDGRCHRTLAARSSLQASLNSVRKFIPPWRAKSRIS